MKSSGRRTTASVRNFTVSVDTFVIFNFILMIGIFGESSLFANAQYNNRGIFIFSPANLVVSTVTQADDFVPVSAHLSSVEGYKVALEELRKRYDDNVHDKEDEVEGLEKSVAQLSERVEVRGI